MIRGVVFDCFGVLAHGYLDYLRSIVPPEHLQELNDLSHASDRGMITQKEYMYQAGGLLGVSPEEVEAIVRKQLLRIDEMTELIRSLRPQYKVAMLSNIGPGVMDELFPESERPELFDAVILSSEAGVVKPNREAFELAAQRLSLSPKECVMIDDLPVNVEGAQMAGMQGIICKSPAQCAEDLRKMLKEYNAGVTRG